MELSDNFAFNSAELILIPMQNKLNDLYLSFLKSYNIAKDTYSQLVKLVTNIMDSDELPSLQDVDLINSDLGQLLVTLNDGGINFEELGQVVFGMSYCGFYFDTDSGAIKSLPPETVTSLINWIDNSIKNGTSELYLNTVKALGKLIQIFDKIEIEKLLVLIESITVLDPDNKITVDLIKQKLNEVGLDFTNDPDISKIDENITELFVQKHLVTTKLYNELTKKIISLGGYNPTVYRKINETLNTPYKYD